ncbi:MAG: rocE [Gammaproteobacteria bacterium]|nr:rocE [Gammaproteobacteria bacterium]
MPNVGLATSALNSKRGIGRGGYFALSFGSIVGSGWIMLLGEWFRLAAPGGALLALLAGGALMALIGMCYAELASRLPRAGGEFLYALEGWGKNTAFIVGWFITLFLVVICAFEGTALAWMVDLLVPAAKGPALYRILGEPVTLEGLVLGLGGAGVICALNLSGLRASVLFQRVVTFGFIAVMGALIVAGLLFGDHANLRPLLAPPGGSSWMIGSLWIFATCAMLLCGFQSALYVIEERAADVDVRTATGCMVLGIAAATIFYAAIVVSAGSIVPWRHTLEADLPAVAAFDALRPGAGIAAVILVVSLFSLAKTWNAVLLSASRMILAQSKAGLLPAALGRLDTQRDVASNAIWLATVASGAGMLLGRGALVPMVNMATLCVSLTIVLMLMTLVRLRRRQPQASGFNVPVPQVTIPVSLAGAVLMASFAVGQPVWREHGFPLEWKLVLAWAFIGLLFRRLARPRERRSV